MTLKKSITFTFFCLSILHLSACQTISTTTDKVNDTVTGLFTQQDKMPEIDAQGIVDLSKASLEQYEQLSATLPLNQWVYLENEKQGTYQLRNTSTEGLTLFFGLNCKISQHQPTFHLQDLRGKVLLKAHDEDAGQIQFLLDNKNYRNPFDPYQHKNLPHFQQQLAQAKVIKIFNAGKLYTFQNQNAVLLSKPTSCRENT